MAQRSEPLQLAWLGFVALAGVAIAYEGASHSGELALLPFGAMAVVFGVTVGAVLIGRRRHPGNLPRAYLGTAPDGDPALVLPRWRLPWRATVVLGAALAAMFAFWAVEAILGPGRVALGIACALIAVVLALPPLFVLTGRVGAGGVYLTPTHLHHRLGGAVSCVAWDHITAVVGGRRQPVRPAVVADVVDQHYTAPFFRGAKLPGKAVLTTRVSGVPLTEAAVQEVFLDLRDIYPDPVAVIDFVHAYWRMPQERAELGQPAALERFRQFTASDPVP